MTDALQNFVILMTTGMSERPIQGQGDRYCDPLRDHNASHNLGSHQKIAIYGIVVGPGPPNPARYFLTRNNSTSLIEHSWDSASLSVSMPIRLHARGITAVTFWRHEFRTTDGYGTRARPPTTSPALPPKPPPPSRALLRIGTQTS